MKSEFDRIKDVIVQLVSEGNHQRLKPHDLHKSLSGKLGGSVYSVQQALNDLVREGRLIFTYSDPSSYVALPGAKVWPAEARLPDNEYERLKEDILMLVADAENKRLRPHALEKSLSSGFGGSLFTVQQALNDLVREGKLVFSYRDPSSYVEIPPASARSSA